jgi:hypothetical protein
MDCLWAWPDCLWVWSDCDGGHQTLMTVIRLWWLWSQCLYVGVIRLWWLWSHSCLWSDCYGCDQTVMVVSNHLFVIRLGWLWLDWWVWWWLWLMGVVMAVIRLWWVGLDCDGCDHDKVELIFSRSKVHISSNVGTISCLHSPVTALLVSHDIHAPLLGNWYQGYSRSLQGYKFLCMCSHDMHVVND